MDEGKAKLIKEIITRFITHQDEKILELENIKVKLDLYEELIRLLDNDIDIVIENKIIIEILLDSIYNLDTYNMLFINKVVSNDEKEIHKLLKTFKEQYEQFKLKESLLTNEIKNYKALSHDANVFLVALKNKIPVNRICTENVKRILLIMQSEMFLENKDMALLINELNFYSQKISMVSEKDKIFIYNAYLKIPTIVNMGYEVIKDVEVEPNRKVLLDNVAKAVYKELGNVKPNDIEHFFIYYLEEDYDIEEVQYITGKTINLMQNDLVIYYEFAIENAENKENEARKSITDEYFSLFNKYVKLRKYYDKIEEMLEYKEVPETEELPLKVDVYQNELYFASSKANPLKSKILADLKDIPEEYYENIYSLLEEFKKGTLPKGAIKKLQNNGKLEDVYEIKGFQIRIIFKQIQNNSYCILGAFIKKDNNDIKSYNNIGRRKMNIPQNLIYAKMVSSQMQKELYDVLLSKKRTSTL